MDSRRGSWECQSWHWWHDGGSQSASSSRDESTWQWFGQGWRESSIQEAASSDKSTWHWSWKGWRQSPIQEAASASWEDAASTSLDLWAAYDSSKIGWHAMRDALTAYKRSSRLETSKREKKLRAAFNNYRQAIEHRLARAKLCKKVFGRWAAVRFTAKRTLEYLLWTDDNMMHCHTHPIGPSIISTYPADIQTSSVSISHLNPMAPVFYPTHPQPYTWFQQPLHSISTTPSARNHQKTDNPKQPHKAKKQPQPKSTASENTQQKEPLCINKSEEDWQLRLQKRHRIVASIKETPEYQAVSAQRE